MILNGKQYTTYDMHKLPADLQPELLMTQRRGNQISFFSAHSKLSNHYPATFIKDGLRFESAEHFYIFKMAKFFNDEMTASKILKCDHAGEVKQMSRRIKNFDEEWRKVTHTCY